jgi:TPR repeat protein
MLSSDELADALFERGRKYADDGDDTKAIFCYHRAADHGHSDAQIHLGHMLYDTDWAAAIGWWERAAAQGSVMAMYNAGVGYLRGGGDLQWRAIPHLLRAAAQGCASSHGALGFAYYHGIGVLQDRAEAARAFQVAADMGRIDARCYIAYMYARADGVSQDDARAAHYFHLACLDMAEASPVTDLEEVDGAEELAMVRARIAVSRTLARVCCLGCGVTRELNTGKLKRCSKCKIAKFCSDACMACAWSAHRPNCRRWREEDRSE